MRAYLIVLGMLAACDMGARPQPPAPVPPQPPAHPLAVVIVVEAQEIFVGNDSYEPDENARYRGVFHEIAALLDQQPLASISPPGSQGAVVGYSSGAELLVPMGPIERVRGSLFADQKPHRYKAGEDMVIGIERGLLELVRADAAKKVMFVMGTGHDTNNEHARTRLRELDAHLRAAGITMHGIVWRSHCGPDFVILPNVTCAQEAGRVTKAIELTLR